MCSGGPSSQNQLCSMLPIPRLPVKGIIHGGYLNSDGEHLTRMSTDNIALCMRQAMEAAQCCNAEIDCM